MSVSICLVAACSLDKNLDWFSYPTIKFHDIPDVEIVLINRPDLGYLGAGESSLVPVPAAIANAIFDATGARVRDIPMTPERVLVAFEKSHAVKPASGADRFPSL